jgi:hypothetical protein
MIPGNVVAQKFFLSNRSSRYSEKLELGADGGKSVEFNLNINPNKNDGEDTEELRSGADTSEDAPVGRSGTRH